MNAAIKSVLILTCFCLSGCGWITSIWPRGQKDVPVTQPSQAGEPIAFDQQPVEVDTNDGAAETQDDDQGPEAITVGPDDKPDEEGDQLRDPDDQTEPIGDEQVVATTALVINNHFITVDDILRGAAGQLAALDDNLNRGQFVQQASRIIQGEIYQQVNLALVLDKAQAEMVEQQQQMLDAQMDKIRRAMIADAGGSQKKLEADLIEQGTTLDYVLDRQRKSIIVSSYMQAKFADSVVVTRRKLWDYYQQHIEDYSTDRKIQVRLIAAPFEAFVDPDKAPSVQAVKEAARKHIAAAKAELEAGRDFADVAKEFSKGPRATFGGLWPMLPAGSMRERKVEQVAFSLPEGELSDIIETDAGFYIVSPVKIQAGQVVSFLDAQKDIADKIRQEETASLRQEYYRRLHEEAVVTESQQFMDVVISKAVQRYLD
ncbi:MAG: peptidylprolyl isomerase [Phycisphaerae bacterium]